MPASLDEIENLFAAVKHLRDERRKMEKLSERAFNAPAGKEQKASVDLNWQAFHVAGIEHTVHARAVDCGYADLRSPQHYAPYSVKLTGWHEYQQTPAKPKSFATQPGPTTMSVLPENSAMTKPPTKRAMKAAVEMEIHAACSTTTQAKGFALDECFPAYDDMLEALNLMDAFLYATAPESNERQIVLRALALTIPPAS